MCLFEEGGSVIPPLYEKVVSETMIDYEMD